jgi:hypothetical protein
METEKLERPSVERMLGIGALTWSCLTAIAFFLASNNVLELSYILIIPIFIFPLAPTMALWLAVWWILNELIRRIWPTRWSLLVTLIPLVATMTAIPASKNEYATRQYKSAVNDLDVLPREKLVLSGNVLVLGPQFPDENWRALKPLSSRQYQRTAPWSCNDLCIALLGTKGVTSVTVDVPLNEREYGSAGFSTNARTYRLVPKAKCPANPSLPDFGRGGTNDEWTLRLSTTECLVAERASSNTNLIVETRTRPAAKQNSKNEHIFDWSFNELPVSLHQLLVRDASDQVLLQKSIVRGSAYVVPLVAELETGYQNPSYFRWGTTPRSNALQYEDINAKELLNRYTSLHDSNDATPDADALRTRLETLVARRQIPRDDLALELISPWFSDFKKSKNIVSEEEMALANKLVAHRSIYSYSGFNNFVAALDPAQLQRMRTVIAERLVSETELDEAGRGAELKQLTGIYIYLPAKGALELSQSEISILADPEKRKLAPELMVREAERGAIVVPKLMDWLRVHTAANHNRKDRWDDSHTAAIDAIRRSFCILGPKAKPVLAEIDQMFTSGQIGTSVGDDNLWHLVLIRLGKPIDLISKPKGLSGSERLFRSRLREHLERFNPKNDCQAHWM